MGEGGAHPLEMTGGFLIQLYKLCCSFDMYYRLFTYLLPSLGLKFGCIISFTRPLTGGGGGGGGNIR